MQTKRKELPISSKSNDRSTDTNGPSLKEQPDSAVGIQQELTEWGPIN